MDDGGGVRPCEPASVGDRWHGVSVVGCVTIALVNVAPIYDGDACIGVTIVCGPYTHGLRGMDRYWWTDTEFGSFNVDTWQYQGRQSVSYRCDDNGIVDTGGIQPPSGATIVEGHMVSDVRARELGLL